MCKTLSLKLGLIVVLINLVACATTNSNVVVEETQLVGLDSLLASSSKAFGPSILPESESEIFSLTESQEKHFLEFYHSPENAELEGHERLNEYLLSFGDNFSYSDYTKTAEITQQTASGNCISLAVLTTAYAQLVDLKVKYQLAIRVPVYQQFGSIIFNAEHVRTMVFENNFEIVDGVMTIPGYSLIDYYPSRYSKIDGYISKEQFLGRYYRNLAAEALGNNDNREAFWMAKYSLESEAENADAINSIAVANRRSGQLEMAERFFEYGLKLTDNKLVLLKNYKLLLTQQGRISEVEEINKQLKAYNDKNPFEILTKAEQAFAENDFTKALDLYQTIISFAPYVHQAYFGIAKSEYKRGNLVAANEALQRALQETYDGEVKTVYQAKLSALKKLD